MTKIRWARNLSDICWHTWDTEPDELDIVLVTDGNGQSYAEPASGQHTCVKDAGHEQDPTNDDHQCCCGATL
jgi:hypothetical protein